MSQTLNNATSGAIIEEIATVIVANKAWLSEIDGKIGDGDHGVNMAKGFGRTADNIHGKAMSLDATMAALSDVLMSEIGGSMGPLYGLMFEDMAGVIAGKSQIGADDFAAMLEAGLAGVQGVGSAEVGDKTLIDTLFPAVAAFQATKADGFPAALAAMRVAAEKGRDSTINLVARIGRASRLGERSRGVLDAGATSCCMILLALADGVEKRLDA